MSKRQLENALGLPCGLAIFRPVYPDPKSAFHLSRAESFENGADRGTVVSAQSFAPS
jgi:hypothetical protein